MGDLSEHFSRWEFRCHCSDQSPQHCHGTAPVSMELVYALEHLRQTITRKMAKLLGHEIEGGCPIDVRSGFRCIPWNEECGGVPDSQHVLGLAADISVEGLTPHDLITIAKEEHSFGGTGEYGTFVHLDMGPSGRRWDFSGEPELDVMHDAPA